MHTNEIIKMKIKSLKEKGLVENRDFRVVYFNDKAEIKVLNFTKLIPEPKKD